MLTFASALFLNVKITWTILLNLQLLQNLTQPVHKDGQSTSCNCLWLYQQQRIDLVLFLWENAQLFVCPERWLLTEQTARPRWAMGSAVYKARKHLTKEWKTLDAIREVTTLSVIDVWYVHKLPSAWWLLLGCFIFWNLVGFSFRHGVGL